MQVSSGKETPFASASYSSGVGSYTSSGTNFNTTSPIGNLKINSPFHKTSPTINHVGRPLSYSNFHSSNVEVKNSIYNGYDIPNTDKLHSPLVHNEILAHEVKMKYFHQLQCQKIEFIIKNS